MNRFNDPYTRVAGVLWLLVVAGVVTFILAWRGVAATLAVWIQVPLLVSGSMAGAALIGGGLGLLCIHMDRQAAADDEDTLEQITEEMAAFLRTRQPAR